MTYIQQAFKGRNSIWLYIATLVIVMLGWQFIGVIPLLIVATMHSSSLEEMYKSAANNFMDLGIDANLFLFLMILMFIGGLIALWFSVKYIHKRSFTSLITSRKKTDWKRVFFAFGLWFLVSLSLLVLGYFMAPENYTWNFKLIPFVVLVLISFFILPFQTSFEELLFRGYFMQGLGIATIKKSFPFVVFYIIVSVFAYIVLAEMVEFHKYNGLIRFGIVSILTALLVLLLNTNLVSKLSKTPIYNGLHAVLNTTLLPLLVTSVAFGLLHGANPEVEKLGNIVMVYYIGTGLFLGVLTLMDEGTELALGFHAANNIVAAIFVTTTWTVFQTDALLIDNSEPSIGFETFVPVLIIYPILLFIFSKKYGWRNWREKLAGKIVKPNEME
ncbi:MAG: CPBP family glutamic-type intramembrane protease [Flavobacteriaceae bacterium]